ncbi:hypothetical protein HKD37_03G006677 [Glycine soja]
MSSMIYENEVVGDDVIEIPHTKKIYGHKMRKLRKIIDKQLLLQGWHDNTSRKRWIFFGNEYTKYQFKNKFNQLRGKWKDFTNLIKMEIGLGYNSTTRQIIATNDKWKKLCENIKQQSNLRRKVVFLSTIFGDTIASGANQHPSTKSPSISDNDDGEEHDDDQDEHSSQPKRRHLLVLIRRKENQEKTFK